MEKKDKPLISIIAAVAKNNVIGINNSLPWDLPSDMDHFRKITEGKPVIFGQRTFESIGRPLPGRFNVVLTLDKDFSHEGCQVFYSIKEALEGLKDYPEIMICGGVSIYKQFLPLADRMYLTFIDGEFEGDAFFPEVDYSQWKGIERVENSSDSENAYACTFVTFERKK